MLETKVGGESLSRRGWTFEPLESDVGYGENPIDKILIIVCR